LNYFNYFTEVEEFFLNKRQSFKARLSTLDWVLLENWKEQGVPLEAVLKGIERAFERKKDINSLAYCVKFVDQVCEEQKELTIEAPKLPDFEQDEIVKYVNTLAAQVDPIDKGVGDLIRALDCKDLREAEQTLSALEEKLVALLTLKADVVEVKRRVNGELNPFRSTMTAAQLTMLEQQLWRRKLLENAGLPRLSLFYLL
jgi:hypothetical protein